VSPGRKYCLSVVEAGLSELIEPSTRSAVDRYWASEQSGGPINLSFLLSAFWRQKYIIAISIGVGLALTYLAVSMVTPRYTATASILLDTRPPKLFGADGAVPAPTDENHLIENQLEILRSPRIARLALSRMKTREKNARVASASWDLEAAWFADAAQNSSAPSNSSDASKPLRGESEIQALEVEKFLRDLAIERKGRSAVVDVSYTTNDAQRSAMIANAIVDAYVVDQLETKFQATRTANLWLKERLQEAGRELENLEKRRQVFRTDKDLVEIGESTLLQKEIAEHVQQLIAARAAAAEAEARLNQVKELAAAPAQLLSLDLALQSTVVSEYRRQQAEIQRKIGEATSIYGEHHPTVAGLKAQLNSLNREVEQEIKRIIDNRQLASEAANEKLRLLEADLKRLKRTVLQFEEYQIRLGEFQREVSVSSELYSSLLRQYKETRAREDFQSPDARIVSPATPPPIPSHPKKALILLLASVFWFGIGSGLGLVRDIRYRRLRSPADVESALGLECVATLPTIDLDRSNADGNQTRGSRGPICRMLPDDRAASFSQAIFRVRKWIQSCSDQGSSIVIVVAAHPGEGCSTVAAQLALFAGKTGAHTALIDADLRSCELSASLGAENVLSRGLPGEADIKSAVVPLANTDIHFCPAPGRHTCQPLDILASRGTGKFFAALRHEFELIVVDTPPAAHYADASALIEHADCVLLVVTANKTRVNDVSEVVRRFGGDTGPVIGVVLNKAGSVTRLNPSRRRRF